MSDLDREYWHAVRSFIVRYTEYNRQKGATLPQQEEQEQLFSKILSSRQSKEATLGKLTSIELKSDYHQLITLTLMMDLAKWSMDNYEELKQQSSTLDCILSQSINILNNQQQFHTIVPKQCELISSLLCHPHSMENLQSFKILYRKLKDVKQFYPSAIREHQKQCFLKTIEQCIEKASELKNTKIVEFIFNNIFNQLEILQETHEYVSPRLKIIKKLIKNMWTFMEDILYKVGFLLMKYSYQISTNKHLFNYVIPIYENLLEKLLQRPSIAPLLIYKHVVYNNIERILKTGGNLILLEILLSQVNNIFSGPYLEYFMRNYDWNYLEVSICQDSLHVLYEYIENRANEKKFQYELTKLYVNKIHLQIKSYLEEVRGVRKQVQKWKFYEGKRKEYKELIEQMNQKPKKLFKRIDNITNQEIREATILKYVKLIKKTCHLENRSMIDIFSTDNATSAQLFAHYVQIVLRQCKQSNLQEFMRLFTSNFFLTGESQQIARVMDTITQLYYKHQQESNRILRSSDATYTFANAILILNTDLHNPKNEEKMSEQAFIKMCKKINDNEDLPLQVIKKTYNNIKRNKINTFRDRGNMIGISTSNWLIVCTDYQSISLSYYDPQLQILSEKCLQYFIYDVLTSIIDEKETAKLQLLVERFIYDDQVYECEIIQSIRKVVDKKSHIPMHILQKILEHGNFNHNKVNQKILSYYWLGANVIQSFSQLIPTNLICEFLVYTWGVRIELQDNMYLRQSAEVRRIRQCQRYISKRQSKKSFLNMFSSLLSFKQSDDDELQVLPNDINKRTNFKSISNNIFDIIKYSENHRKLAVQFLLGYIHKEESKHYKEFLSCMFLTFNLLYYIDRCEDYGEDLFYELLGLKESSISKRLANLGKNDPKLHTEITGYCSFWILKLLLKDYATSKVENSQDKSFLTLLKKSLELLEKIDKDLLQDLLKELKNKSHIHEQMFNLFDKSIKKIYGKESLGDIQFFYDKFQKKTEKNGEINQKTETKLKTEPIVPQVEKRQDLQVKQTSKVQPTEAKVQELQTQIQEEGKLKKQNFEERVIPASEVEIQEEKLQKRQSVENIDVYINPDAVMIEVEKEIEQHLKQKSEESIKAEEQEQIQPDSQSKKENQQPKEQVKEEKSEIPSEQITQSVQPEQTEEGGSQTAPFSSQQTLPMPIMF